MILNQHYFFVRKFFMGYQFDIPEPAESKGLLNFSFQNNDIQALMPMIYIHVLI